MAQKSSIETTSTEEHSAPPPELDFIGRPSDPPVVGIGASAGGLDAFKKILAGMPTDGGIALVLIPHLAPDHESMMVSLLQQQTKMPVIEAKDGVAVVANHVYVLPPNQYMSISEGRLRLTGPVSRDGPQTSIDLFLRSLAIDKREKAICIILSGTGSHGSLGLRAIKAANGLVIVQDPKTAQFTQMPENGVATGLADHIVPVGEMPQILIDYVRRNQAIETNTDTESREHPEFFEEALVLLRSGSRLDFRCYRKGMLRRRIERRMNLGHFNLLSEYVAFLRTHPDEIKRLAQDLLISVTNFFRDPESWEVLENECLSPLLADRSPESSIRIWSAGCATGEEAYTLGILLLERLVSAGKNCPVQIFATDIDEISLGVARLGVYPEGILSDLSPERLGRHFTCSKAGYQVNCELRDLVTFARQSLISDAPFSKLDLIVCRNVLIYLEPEIQSKVIEMMHFSLNEGGFLFLGSSETIGRHSDLFEPVSKKWRLFRRIGRARPVRVEIPLTTTTKMIPPLFRSPAAGGQKGLNAGELTHRLLAEQFAPASVLINRKLEILYFFGATDRYLTTPSGEPTHDLIRMSRDGLGIRLRPAIQKALDENEPVMIEAVRLKTEGDSRSIFVSVRPAPAVRGGESLLLITFEDGKTEPAKARPIPTIAEENIIGTLETELKATRDDLERAAEELQGSNEELRSSNEEIMSMNEELQSANEELETSKEELQSLNEELSTVNTQLHDKLADLEAATNDSNNLLTNADVAIIFLDTEFRIKRFTPFATKAFNLIQTDIGRPILDIVTKIPDLSLVTDVAEVLRILTPRETQIETSDGAVWTRRITPYLTRDNRIEGVILIYLDVTAVRQADEQARRLVTVLRDSNDAVIVHDFEGNITLWNRGAEKMGGYDETEALRMNYLQTIPIEDHDKVKANWEKLRRRENVPSWECRKQTKNGGVLDISVTATAMLDEKGRFLGIVNTERDITEYKRTIAILKEQEARLAAVLETAADAIITIDGDGLIQSTNQATEKMFGYKTEELIGRNVKMLMPPPHRESHDQYLKNYHETGVAKIIGIGREAEGVRKNGSRFPIDLAVSRVDHLKFFTGIIRDISAREKTKAELLEIARSLHESERLARSTLDGLSAHIAIVNEQGTILAVNKAWNEFSLKNEASQEKVGKGSNYFTVCQTGTGLYSDHGISALTGLKAVLSKEMPAFTMEYPCHGNGIQHWFLMRVTPFPGDGPVRVVVAHENITQRKELEREVVEIAALEQRRIGQDLHDSVGQELTALNLLTGELADRFELVRPDQLAVVDRITKGLKRSQSELRLVLRGLLPVAVDAEGLMSSLTDLADRINQEGKVECEFICPDPVSFADNLTATHLYLIAQEAVHNAVKHAQAKKIVISLESDTQVTMKIRDDGIGMQASTKQHQGGLGIRIMHNRASIIGADLTIQQVEPSGSLVSCTLRGN